MLVKITLDLEFVLAHASCLIPVQFGEPDRPVRQLHSGLSLALPPTPAPVASSKACSLTDAGTDGHRLHIGDSTENTEVHALTVPARSTYSKPPPNGSRLSCGRPARRRKDVGRQSVPRQGHNTPLPLKRSPPGSFKRLLGGGTCSANPLNNAHVAFHSAL